MNKLPFWVVPNRYPANYDSESATVIEMTGKLYTAVAEFINEYNEFATKVNKAISEFEDGVVIEQEEFEIGIRQEFQDFIDIVALKTKKTDAELKELEAQIQTILENGVGGGGGEVVNADYEQNDATAPDFIKNRPFYGEKTQIYSDKDKANTYNGVSVSFDLEVGKTYVVTLNGSEYSCVCKQSTYNDSEAKKLDCGDYAFYIVNGKLYLTYPDGDANLTVAFTIELEDIKKIDKKYLPSDLATKADIFGAMEASY